MTASTLDPRSALVVIDLQKGIVALPTAHDVRQVVQRATSLLDAFRACGLPVVLVTVAGGAPGRTEQPRRGGPPGPDWAEIVPELGRDPRDHHVVKHTWGAFTQTGLEQHLRENGVTQIVLCGVATSIGVESTARQAHEAGFNVTLATDAMTDMSAEAHANSVQRIFPRLGETATTGEILALLGQEPRDR